jgi:hypothetical protein
MAIVSHLHHCFNAETCQSYLVGSRNSNALFSWGL